MHTKDKLADALMRLGLMDMSVRARGGYYHDFLSPLDTPEIQLVNDLHEAAQKLPADSRAAIYDLRAQVINGDFDATLKESDEWAASPEGQYAMRQLIKGRL